MLQIVIIVFNSYSIYLFSDFHIQHNVEEIFFPEYQELLRNSL